jgi:putative ABC transport system ATP-binding protein
MCAPLLEAVGLNKTYRTGSSSVQAVSDVSLTINPGEIVAIVGRSGSGKSTLMSLLGLLERPDSGRYAFGGQDLTKTKDDTLARLRCRSIGFVFQLPSLLARATALENVQLPLAYAGLSLSRSERRARAADALERVGLSHRKDHWPNELSGGEQQRVAIARALINDPALILADEPTGALDTRTAEDILELFEALNANGRTIVVVTHASYVAARADRQILINDGRIMGDTRAPAAAPGLDEIGFSS